MMFDAFGRLALGQVQQSYGAATGGLVGVVGTAAAGTIGAAESTGIVGVAGVASAGSLSDVIRIVVPGVAGTGFAGVIGRAVARGFVGVSGSAQTGPIKDVVAVSVNGVSATAIAGNFIPAIKPATLVGVGATAYAGTINIPTVGGILIGVAGIGIAGDIKPLLSGGGGSKKHAETRGRKAGFERIKKAPAAPPKKKRDTIELPPHRPSPSIVPTRRIPPELIDPTLVVPEPLDLIGQIRNAEDMSDVLQFIDGMDYDEQDIADIMAVLELLD